MLSMHSVAPKGKKGNNVTPVHPVPEEFIHYLFKALICCPWGDVELGYQVAECLVAPQFKLIACLPQGLLYCCHGDHFPGVQASAVARGSIHHRAILQVPGWVAIDGIAVSFLEKLVREKVNH